MEFLEKFLEYLLLEKKYSTHTITSYRKDIGDFFTFLERDYKEVGPTEVEYSYIRAWISELNMSGKANITINRKLTALKSFYNYLQKVEEVSKNPLSKQKSLK